MKIFEITILILFGILVLTSYYIFLIKDSKFGYINHPFWFGLPENIIKIMVVFQILAMIGFLTAVISWIRYPPKQGIMYKNNLFYTLILFLLSASIWPIATHYKIHWAAVLSIILTAISSILLLAGSIEEKKEDIKSYKVIGIIFLCIVTVLCDGVIWNANYIKQIK
jgi:hypothetical protein